MNNTSVRVVAATLPGVQSTPQRMRKVAIDIGSIDIFKKKTGSETLKKDFLFLSETLEKRHLRVSFISGPHFNTWQRMRVLQQTPGPEHLAGLSLP